MTWRHSIPLFVLILLLAACSNSAAVESSREMAPAAAPAADSIAYEESGAAFTSSDTANAVVDTQSSLPQERLIIRTADLSIVVIDTDETIAAITRMAEENEGWVVSSNVYQYSATAKTGDITIRVPSAGFISATEAIKGLATEVRQESVSGQDVTEEFVDLTARLGNLEATAVRVRGFLEDADTVEEALAVNQELSRLEAEIEVIKGRMKFLSESASFSTISVHLTPDELNQPIEIGGWEPQGIAKDALESLISAAQFLVSVLIWLVIFFLPLGVVVVLPLWFVGRWIRRRRRAKKSQPTAVVNEPSAEN
ncbi:MAG: DUF4349 domain-containing protein [Chloroflexi bacterium]|nr:DUF4349 domain-containing protein [Chloroflexota bacterium]MBP7041404.1 DUF4349 domain-containing protein [Chloroflexota bacterium]